MLDSDQAAKDYQWRIDRLHYHLTHAHRLRRELLISEPGEVIIHERIYIDDAEGEEYIGYIEAVADGSGSAVITQYEPGSYICDHEVMRVRLNVPEKEARQVIASWIQERIAEDFATIDDITKETT